MTPKKRLNILLAHDGSEHANAAVEWLQNVPLPPKSRIFVFRAFHSGQIELIPVFERSLERTKVQLASLGYRVETELQLGSAAEKIIEISEAQKTDLIVLGAKGLRATMGILLGGVAQQVVEYAGCPVLIVRAPYRGFCKILLVTDGSPSSQSAARYLGKFLLPEEVDVHVMHVLPPLHAPIMMEPYLGTWQTVYPPQMMLEDETIVRKRETKAGESLLTRTSNLLQRNGIDAKPVLTRGDAATEIINYAKENKIELIVAGSRGLSQFQSLWMGSVSRKLVHYSDCSVLVVKASQKE